MIRSFVEMMLGEYGRQLLYFYEANALVINSIIFTYGLFMLLAWNNLVRVYRFLIIEVAKTIHLDEDLGRKSTNKQVQDRVAVPWEAAVKAAPYPLIAKVGGLLPKRMTVDNLQMFFDEKEIVSQAQKLLKGENIKRMAPISRRMADHERAHKAEKGKEKTS